MFLLSNFLYSLPRDSGNSSTKRMTSNNNIVSGVVSVKDLNLLNNLGLQRSPSVVKSFLKEEGEGEEGGEGVGKGEGGL